MGNFCNVILFKRGWCLLLYDSSKSFIYFHRKEQQPGLVLEPRKPKFGEYDQFIFEGDIQF